jgi:hypothetical protein
MRYMKGVSIDMRDGEVAINIDTSTSRSFPHY